MEGFSQQMAAVTEGIRAAAAQRAAMVQGLQARMRDDLAAGERHRAAAADRRKEAADAAHRARLAGRRRLAGEVAALRRGYRGDLERMKRRLADSLGASQDAMRAAVARRLAACAEDRAAMGEGLRGAAARQRHHLESDRGVRAAYMTGAREHLRLSREDTAQDLAGRLDEFVAGVRAAVAALLAEAADARRDGGREGAGGRERVLAAVRRRIEALEAGTRTMVAAFARERAAMADGLRRSLEAAHRGRLQEVQALLGGCRTLRDALQEDFRAARGAWTAAAASRAEVSARPARPQGPRAAAPGPDRVDEELRAAEERKAREQAEARRRQEEEERRAREARHPLSDEEKVLKVIRRHPEGISATQIGEMVGLHASMAGRVATELAEAGKVTKDESARLYYPGKGR